MTKSRKALYFTILISTVIRCFIAYFIEFGNDEVYYVNYALFPDLSHFDHPPFVGWLIQLTTINFLFDNEFFIRFGAVIISSINTYLIFKTTALLRNERAGLYAALLYTASLYSFVIVGVFIMPDAPQSLFWLLSLFIATKIFINDNITKQSKILMLVLGCTIGLGMLSKYTSAFLWVGVGLYILFFARKWLMQPSLYIAVLISLLLLTPVIVWNINNDFITVNFHSGRITIDDNGFNYTTLLTEIGGSMFYNNVINVFIIITSIAAYIFKYRYTTSKSFCLLVFFSAPIILLFLCFSMFRQTLPHWSAPGYFSLMIIAALYLEYKSPNRLPRSIIAALCFISIIVGVGITQIKSGFINLSNNDPVERLGFADFSLDMYGYRQLGDKFMQLRNEHVKDGIMTENPIIIGYKWFPTSHIDYYVARPNGIKVMTLSPLFESHKYAWITQYRGGLTNGTDAYFINSSRYRIDVNKQFAEHFDSIKPIDTIQIYRCGKHSMNYVVWYMKGLKNIPKLEIKNSQF